MSLFHFHVTGAQQFLDVEGTSLDSFEAVRREAVMIARELVLLPNGECPALSSNRSVKIWVTNSAADPEDLEGEGTTVLVLEVRLMS